MDKQNNFGGLINPLEEAQRIAPTPFKPFEGGPLDKEGPEYWSPMRKARQKVQESVKRFDSLSSEEKIKARKQLPKMYRELNNDDDVDKKEMRRLKDEKKKIDRDADLAYEKKLEENAFKKAGITKSEYNKLNAEEKLDVTKQAAVDIMTQKISDWIGKLVDNSTITHASTLTGDIDRNNTRITLANAYKRKQELEKQLQTLIHDRDAYLIPTKDSNPNFQEQLQFYEELISDTERRLANPELNQMAELYQADYVESHQNALQKVANWIGRTWDDTVGSWTIVGKSDDVRAMHQQRRTRELAAQYDRIAASDEAYNKAAVLNANQKTDIPTIGDYESGKFNPIGNLEVGMLETVQQQSEDKPKSERDEVLKKIYDKQHEVRLAAADKYIKDREKEIKADEEEYVATLKLNNQLDQYFKVPDEFKKAEAAYQSAPWYSPGYWFYAVPGLIGSSNSSYNQMLGNIIQYGSTAAAIAAAPVSGGASLAIYNAGVVGATPFQAEGVYDENKAELSEKKISNIKSFLKDENAYDRVIANLHFNAIDSMLKQGFTLDQIKKRYGTYADTEKGAQWNPTDEQVNNLIQDYTAGLIVCNDPAMLKANLVSSRGLEALYEANNIRTGGELAMHKAIELTPMGAAYNKARGFVFNQLDKLGERIASKELVNEVTAQAGGKVTAKVANEATKAATVEAEKKAGQRYVNGFRRATTSEAFKHGAEVGAATAAAAGHGIVGTTVAGAIGGTVNAGLNLAKAALKPSQRAIINKFEEIALNKYQKFYDTMFFNKEWAKLVAKYGVKSAKSAALSGFTEGAEEAVQYMNSLEDYASKYGFGGMSISDLIANDIAQGSKVMDAYLSVLGLGHSEYLNDEEWWQNWQGGFVLGGARIGTMKVPFKGVQGLARELNTYYELAKESGASREADKISRQSYRTIAKEIMNGKSDAVMNVLNHLEEQDRRREDPQYSQESYDAQKKAARIIGQLAKDKTIREQLEKQGIKYGTHQYATALADLYTLSSQKQEGLDARNGFAEDINGMYMSEEFSNAVKERVDAYVNGDILGKRTKFEAKNQIAKAAREAELQRAKEAGEDVESVEFKAKLDLLEREAFDNADKQVEQNVQNGLYQRARLENKLLGLLKVKAQQNTIEDWYNVVHDFTGIKALRPDARVIRTNIENQIKEVKESLSKIDDTFDKNMSDEQILNYIKDDEDYISVNSENIQQVEAALAMTDAEIAVTDNYLSTLSDKDNRYARRIEAIQKAEDDNAKLDTLINDIYSGDAVTKLYEVFEEEDKKERQKKEAIAKKVREQIKQEQKAPEFGTSTEEKISSVEEKAKKAASNLSKNKAKYQERKEKARQSYARRKNKYNKHVRSSLGMRIPFEQVFVNAANNLIRIAEIGAYKFDEFVQDAKDIIADASVDEILPILKQLYIKGISKYQVKNPSILSNLSTVEEVLNYTVNRVLKALYITPSLESVAAATFIKNQLDESRKNIIAEVSTHYHTFVKEGDEVVIYPNKSSIALDNEYEGRRIVYDGIITQLNLANTSEESFRNKLRYITKDQEGFPVDEYTKYRNVDGVVEAIAMAIVRWNGHSAIDDGITVANIVAHVMNGTESEAPTIASTAEYNLLISQLKDIKLQLESQGYELIDSNSVVYGKDKDGNKLSSLADLIFIHKKTGKLFVIDVRTSYLSVTQGWDHPVSRRKGILTTIGQSLTNNLHQIEDILSFGKFGFIVERMGVIPVLYDNERPGHIKLDNNVIPINIQYEDRTHTDKDRLEEKRNQAKNLVDDYNKLVDEVNNIVSRLENLGVYEYASLPYIELVEQTSIESYDDYIFELEEKYNDLNSQLDDMNSELYSLTDAEDFVWHEVMLRQEPVAVPQRQQDLLLRLSEACEELDSLISLVPNKKASTQKDRDNVKRLYQAIFDAQVALNDYLELDKENTIDVTREEELIAAAIEKLVENNENFGRLSVFVTQWWLNNFSKGITDNTSEKIAGEFHIFNAYRIKIGSWISTLSQHVIEDLDGRYALQEFYSSLLKNYFSVLVDNFERFSETLSDPAAKVVSQDIIAEARSLIEEFELTWGVLPNDDYQGPSENEEEYINGLSVRWKDHYGPSDSHSPSFDDMSNPNEAYYYMSQRPDFLENYRIGNYEITNDPEHRPVFAFLIDKNGKVKLHFQYWDKQQNKKRFQDLGFEIDIPGAIARGYASQEQIEWFRRVNRANDRFTNKVKRALEYIKKTPGKKLSFRLSMDKGSIRYDKNKTPKNVFEWLFTGNNSKDMYTIRISRQNGLGITKFTVDKNTGRVFYDVFAGEDLTQKIGQLDDTFRKQNSQLQSGLIVYFYNTGNGQQIAVPIISAQIGQDATKIVELLQQYARGNRYDKDGFSILDLIQMRLHFADPTKRISEFNKIDNTVFDISGTKITIGQVTYDVFDDAQALTAKIAGMYSQTDATLLNENMAFTQHPIIARARLIFANNNQVQSVQLSNGFTMSRDDFQHQNPDGTIGSTWMGHLMRMGKLFTTAVGTDYRQLNIHDVQIVDENEGVETQQQVQQSDTRDERRRAQQRRSFNIAVGLGLTDEDTGLHMLVNENELVTRTREEKQAFMTAAKNYFEKVLGISDFNGFVDQIDKIGTKTAVGVTTSSALKLTLNAPRTAIYHEAFHKILELTLDSDTRNKIYKAYRSKNGEQLSEREVAEGLADMFVDYMQNNEKYKDISWAKPISKVLKKVKVLTDVIKKVGLFSTINFILLYRGINAGKFASTKFSASDEHSRRFKTEFNDALFYTVTNSDTGISADFVHLADSSDVSEVIAALEYYILEDLRISSVDPDLEGLAKVTKHANRLLDYLAPETIEDLTGKGIPDDELMESDLVFREIFESQYEEVENKKGTGTHQVKTYPKFAALSKKIMDALAARIGDYDGKIKDLPEDADEDGTVQKQNIDRYDRASYEFRKLDSATKRAKLFFASVPYMTWSEENGKRVLKLDYSRYNCPTMMPMTEVYNKVVNDLHTIKNHFQLRDELEKRQYDSPMYAYVYDKFNKLMSQIYTYDEHGNIISIDYEKEALAIQIAQTISSQKVNFVIAESVNYGTGKEITVKPSSENRDKYSFAKLWQQNLLSGLTNIFERTTKNGNHVLKKWAKGQNGQDVFHKAASYITHLRDIFSSNEDEFELNGTPCNKMSYSDIQLVKQSIIDLFNMLGIAINMDTFDYMLQQEYHNTTAEGLSKFLTRTDKYTSINSFINLLNNLVRQDGEINQQLLLESYTKSGFVSLLAQYQGAQQRMSVDQSALALKGKKYYTVTQNNTISHITDILSAGNLTNPLIRRLQRFSYVYDKLVGGGSIIQKAILSGEKPILKCMTYIGFKTDNRGDQGSEYTEEATVDDYMAKAAMLQQGYMVPPTLADKGTFTIIQGVKIPGITFVTTKDENGNKQYSVQDVPTVIWINKTPIIKPNSAVINQFLQYAKTERLAIQQCMEDLGYENIPGYEKQGRRKLKEEEKIQNYHTPNKDKENDRTIEPNGTRFWSLTEIAVEENGEIKTYNLNDPRMSSTELLKLANEKFFDRSLEDQEKIIALTLHRRMIDSVKFAVRHGIVERVAQFEAGNPNPIISGHSGGILNLTSKHLNAGQISVVANAIFKSIPQWYNTPLGPKHKLYEDLCRSMAIAAILGDITNRSIISSEEFLRNYIGHPAMFKTLYAKDRIKDSTFDIQKRIGGLISTGEDNMENLPGLSEEYTCAECKDYEVGSTSDVADQLEQMFINGQVREAYGVITGDWSTAYNSSIEALESSKDFGIRSAINSAKILGRQFANAYKEKINVADGAAYITADMCKNLLRMRGAFNGEVEEAFNILTGDQAYSWMDKKEAYNKIYDAVNIVTTKYTAYGFRDHTLNGDLVSDVAVPYYNKFALFPLFDCLATGNMKGIYDKMKREKVDMLLMNSAVKVGSQGSVEYNGEFIEKPFNKYQQEYSFLRRQLNTDPEEGDTIAAGTQMIKIALSNLRLLRDNYFDSEKGENVTGRMLLNSIMDSIKALSSIGEEEIRDMFYTEGKPDVDKLSKFLKDELSSRNANKALIEAIEVTTENGVKKLKCPLSATPDASWIESIVIATVNRRVIDIVTPGSSFVQRSVFATENTRKDGEGRIQGDEKLQMINEEGSMDAKISIDYFESMLPKGLSFNEARQWLIDNGIIGSNAHANTIGYRIPTQAQSSIHALRFIDVIPAVKSTIILPEEFTKITGSDFDIDHLYLMSYNYTKGKDGKLTKQMDKEKNSKKWHQNNIMDCMLTLLKDTKYSMNSLYKSIDNDTELAKSIADLIPEEDSRKQSAYNFGTLHEQVERKNDYINGKEGIGPFALNVTNQILTYLYGVRFKSTRFTESTGIYRFNHIQDKDGYAIQSWIGAFINGHVDIVKDPWVAKLNVNKFTYNMLNLLLRSGYGAAAMWFITQPIIRDMAQASIDAESQFLRNQKEDPSVWKAKERMVLQAVKQYVPEQWLKDTFMKNFLDKDIVARINSVNYVLKNSNVLREIVLGTSNLSKDEINEVQVKVYLAWKALEKYAIALGNLVQRSKIDTRKHGKTFLEIRKYLYDYEKLFHPAGVDRQESIWDVNQLERFARQSWLDQKTYSAINLPFEILGGQTFQGNNSFVNSVLNIARSIVGINGDMTNNLIKDVSRALQTKIKSEYFIDYAKNYLGMSDEDITGMFVGNFTIATRLNNLQYLIEHDDRYRRLANNRLLTQVIPVIQNKSIRVNGQEIEQPQFITVRDNVDGSRANSDDLIDGWTDLLNDQDEAVRKFARHLIVYSFLTSGEYKGWNKMFKFVPPAFIRGEVDTDYEESFAQFVERKLSQPVVTNEADVDDIVSNNDFDHKFVKNVQSVDENGKRNILVGNSLVAIGKSIPASEINDQPKYITIKNDKEHNRNRNSKSLYKLVNIYTDSSGNHYPVYMRMRHKGYKLGNQNIYEYGWMFSYDENGLPQSRLLDYQKAEQKLKDFLDKFVNLTDGEFEFASDDTLANITAELWNAENMIQESKTVEKEQPSKNTAKRDNITRELYTENGVPVVMYRGYALTEDREANSIEETIGRTAVDYDESLKGSIYFTSSWDEANDYAKSRSDSSDEEFVRDGQVIKQRNRHYTGDYAKVSAYNISASAKVEHYNDMADYVKNGKDSDADVIILDHGTMWHDNTEYIVKNPAVIVKQGELHDNWRYLEDSTIDDTLNYYEPTGRNMMFGRKHISINDRGYITETPVIVDKNGNESKEMAEKLSNLIQQIQQAYDKTGKVTVKYSEWKALLQNQQKLNLQDNTINQFEYFVSRVLNDYMEDWFGTDVHGSYNKNTKEITFEADYYNVVKVLHDNIDVLQYFTKGDEDQLWKIIDGAFNSENIYDFFVRDLLDGDNVLEHKLTYKYDDLRQMSLFTEEELEEARKQRKHCEGGV